MDVHNICTLHAPQYFIETHHRIRVFELFTMGKEIFDIRDFLHTKKIQVYKTLKCVYWVDAL